MRSPTPLVVVDDARRCLAEVPRWVLSAAAEQLRWDALRAGHVRPRDWPRLRATVDAASCPDQSRSAPQESGFVVMLTGGQRPIRRVYPPRLQALELFLACGWGSVSQDGPVRLRWSGGPTSLPLSPLRLPFASLPASWRPGAAEQSRLALEDGVGEQLARLCDESLRGGVELAGCLLGRVPTPEELRVEELCRAPDAGGAPERFAYAPAFWVEMARRTRRTHRRVLGWVHTHLLDRGHPPELSRQDLLVAHRRFAAPWQLAALICAAAEGAEVRWFGWQDAAVVDRGEHTPLGPFLNAPQGETR